MIPPRPWLGPTVPYRNVWRAYAYAGGSVLAAQLLLLLINAAAY